VSTTAFRPLIDQAPDATLPVREVLRVAAAVITARGYYQPMSRMWEPQIPTALDVEAYLDGRTDAPYGEIRAAIDADADAVETAAAVLAWCRDGGEDDDPYRLKLTALTRYQVVNRRNVSALASAVSGWQHDQRRRSIAAERAQAARCSRPQGERGDRLTFTATVVMVRRMDDRSYGYRVQARHMIQFRDGGHNVYTWFASAASLPKAGQTVTLCGTVAKHETFQGTARTQLTRCRWTPAD
jgi:hypothetical protein